MVVSGVVVEGGVLLLRNLYAGRSVMKKVAYNYLVYMQVVVSSRRWHSITESTCSCKWCREGGVLLLRNLYAGSGVIKEVA